MSRRDVTVHSQERVFDGRYKIDEAVFSFDKASGPGRIEKATRLVFERGDSAAALLHDVERDVVIVSEQFRFATHAKGPGYLIEMIAGSVEAGEAPDACIRRELMEEVGYRVGKLDLIGRFYASPGASSERIFLYYARVRPEDLVDPAASGVAADDEDVRRIELPRTEFLARLDEGAFEDAKLAVAGYWLKSQRAQGKPRR
jgi:nudix-type nucleoside diphosphatase (YffH/AdpP family)